METAGAVEDLDEKDGKETRGWGTGWAVREGDELGKMSVFIFNGVQD